MSFCTIGSAFVHPTEGSLSSSWINLGSDILPLLVGGDGGGIVLPFELSLTKHSMAHVDTEAAQLAISACQRLQIYNCKYISHCSQM